MSGAAVETLEATLTAKAAAKYDVALEGILREWIQGVLQDPLAQSSPSFAEYLKDGTVLCRLVNTLVPETKAKINSSTLPFKQLENISNYLTVCERWLQSEKSSFRSTDLYEAKDLNAVLGNLNALRSLALKHGDGLAAYVQSLKTSSSSSSSSSSASSSSASTTTTSSSSNLTPTSAKSSSSFPIPSSSSSSQSLNSPTSSSSSSSSFSATDTKIGVTKLEDDVRTKAEFKFNVEHGENILKWIDAVLGRTLPDRDFHNALKSGEVLCDLLNVISPKAIPTIHRTSLAFKQMENISNYLKACRDILKMNDTDLFETADLFKKQNLSGVANHVDILARLAATLPGGDKLPKLQTTQSLSLWSASLVEGFDFLADSANAPEASSAQEKELVRWINRQLSSLGSSPISTTDFSVEAVKSFKPIRNLSTDLRTGVVIILLLEKLTSQSFGLFEPNPTSLGHCISNASRILRFLSSQLFEQVEFITATDIVQAKVDSLIKFTAWAREKFDLEYAFLALLGRSAEEEQIEEIDQQATPRSQDVVPPISSSSSTTTSPSTSSSSSAPSSTIPTLTASPRSTSSTTAVSSSPSQEVLERQSKVAELDEKIQTQEKEYQELSNLVFRLQNTASELQEKIATAESRFEHLMSTIDTKSKAWEAERTQRQTEFEEKAAQREAKFQASQEQHKKAISQLEEKKKSLDAECETQEKALEALKVSVLVAKMNEVQTQSPTPEPTTAPTTPSTEPTPSTEEPQTALPTSSSTPSTLLSPDDVKKSKHRSKSSSKSSSSSSKSSGKRASTKSSTSSSAPSVSKPHSRRSSSRPLGPLTDAAIAEMEEMEKKKAELQAQIQAILSQSTAAHQAKMEELRLERQKFEEEAAAAREQLSKEMENLQKEMETFRAKFEEEKQSRSQWEREWSLSQSERKNKEEAWKKEEETRIRNIRAFARTDVAQRASVLRKVNDPPLIPKLSPPTTPTPTPPPAAVVEKKPAAKPETPEVLAAQCAIRKRIAQEILSTEQSYLNSLKTLARGFLKPLQSVLSNQEISLLFSTLPDLVTYHTTVLTRVEGIVSSWSDTSCVSEIFLQFQVEPYFSFVASNSYVPLYLRVFKAKYPNFAQILKQFESAQKSRLDVESLMIMPVQRLPRYVLLLREMRKYSSVSAMPASCDALDKAIQGLQSSLDLVNARMDKRVASSVPAMQSIIDNTDAPNVDLPSLVVSQNRYLASGPITLTFKKQETSSAKTGTKVPPGGSKIVAPKKNTDLLGWLFNDLIVFVEKVGEVTADPNAPKAYRLVVVITIADYVGWAESKRPNCFGIEFCSVKWVFQASTPEIRSAWTIGLVELKENQRNQLFALK